MSRPTRDAITFAFVGSAFSENKGALHGLVPLFAGAPKFRSRSHKLLIPLCGKSGFVTTTTR
jgi:hypothetical protein